MIAFINYLTDILITLCFAGIVGLFLFIAAATCWALYQGWKNGWN